MKKGDSRGDLFGVLRSAETDNSQKKSTGGGGTDLSWRRSSGDSTNGNGGGMNGSRSSTSRYGAPPRRNMSGSLDEFRSSNNSAVQSPVARHRQGSGNGEQLGFGWSQTSNGAASPSKVLSTVASSHSVDALEVAASPPPTVAPPPTMWVYRKIGDSSESQPTSWSEIETLIEEQLVEGKELEVRKEVELEFTPYTVLMAAKRCQLPPQPVSFDDVDSLDALSPQRRASASGGNSQPLCDRGVGAGSNNGSAHPMTLSKSGEPVMPQPIGGLVALDVHEEDHSALGQLNLGPSTTEVASVAQPAAAQTQASIPAPTPPVAAGAPLPLGLEPIDPPEVFAPKQEVADDAVRERANGTDKKGMVQRRSGNNKQDAVRAPLPAGAPTPTALPAAPAKAAWGGKGVVPAEDVDVLKVKEIEKEKEKEKKRLEEEEDEEARKLKSSNASNHQNPLSGKSGSASAAFPTLDSLV